MTTFTDYLQNIQLTVFDYLCDTIIRNSDDEEYPSYSVILYNEQDLYRGNEFSNRHIFNSFKRTFTNCFYYGETMLVYYGVRNIPNEYRAEFINELKQIVGEDGEEYYNTMVKCGQDEDTYDDKLLIHYWNQYAIKYISLTNFTNYYYDKINVAPLK